MILGFKQQFKEPILNYKKIHSIRKDLHKRWKPGMKIHFATGVRTKNYNNFLIGTCDSVQEIGMTLTESTDADFIVIDNYAISVAEKIELAKNDGFVSYEEFKEWFLNEHGTIFNGRIIHFTNKRY